MKAKVGVNFHNRFDIEVRDKDTGEVKQRGQAENIVLDRAYTRLCNYSSYFVNICFGSGTGTLDPTRTTLFSSLGYKAAVTEEIIKAYPISKWTRKITLNPEEYVGENITEVGISDTTNAINTHALITDAEGNQLSINKTDVDVVVIYATVFVELQNKNDNIKFSNLPRDNVLLDYLLGGSAPSPTIRVGSYFGNTFDGGDIGGFIQAKTPSKTVDVPNKKVIYSTRFGINEGNGAIGNLGLSKVFGVSLPEEQVFTEHLLTANVVGIGDGETNIFTLPHHRAYDITVKVDGIVVSNYSISYEADYYNIPFDGEGDFTVYANDNYSQRIPNKDMIILRTSLVNNTSYIYKLVGDSCVNIYKPAVTWTSEWRVASDGRYIRHYATGGPNDTYYYWEVNDDDTFTARGTSAPSGVTWINNPIEGEYRINNGVQRLKDNVLVKVTFDTPPPENAVITADYKVPFIPKTSDYVLDVTMEVIFGEGA